MADGCKGEAKHGVAAQSAWLIGYMEEAMRIQVSRRMLQLIYSGTRAGKVPEQVANVASITAKYTASTRHCTERAIKYAEECILLDERGVIAVHKSPSFMSSLGRCTYQSGKVWRMEGVGWIVSRVFSQ
ncbi:hypothetical protein KXD40_002171 [Peronospora effusa]|nr:hypothetical protein KXD40_002171 [Peronospora effusa]